MINDTLSDHGAPSAPFESAANGQQLQSAPSMQTGKWTTGQTPTGVDAADDPFLSMRQLFQGSGAES